MGLARGGSNPPLFITYFVFFGIFREEGGISNLQKEKVVAVFGAGEGGCGGQDIQGTET
jgi:hypothetical protein